MAENVRGLLSIENGLVFQQVCLDLESIGYEVQPFVIPARRQRPARRVGSGKLPRQDNTKPRADR